MTAQLLFFAFLAITLGITWWAARKTRTADHFYAAGRDGKGQPHHERHVLALERDA